ncbi:MAG: acyltransferase family protein [Mycobacteriaceae bacterium]|uniref:acyltransferase family protein n=1 Tax=Corynebacterium sp. TaxID=1720 RepID=UPI003F98E1C4
MTGRTEHEGPGAGTRTRARSSLRRTDIDGLRGLAIALVVIFHVFVGRVSSGMDVFLLLGGLFFFAPQIRNALDPSGLTLVQSVLRILRRLYPALVTVVAVTLVAAVAVYAPVRWTDAGRDAAASLLYLQNLNLGALGQDYAAISDDVSLYQHIWSMSVQLQIYLGSLVLITVLGAVTAAKAGRDVARRTIITVLVVATIASVLYAAWLGGVDQGANYYSPLSRFWEIGLGGLFGLWVLGRDLPRWWAPLRWPAGLAGLVLIIGTGLVLDGAASFPGPWTLVPLAGAVLVVLAGSPVKDGGQDVRPVTGVSVLLETRVFQLLGRNAYSLYLWHWPILTLATYVVSNRAASAVTVAPDPGGLQGITASLGTVNGTLVGTGVIGVSLVLAWATNRFIEVPLQQTTRPARSWVVFDRAYLREAARDRARTTVTMVILVVSVGVVAFGPVVARYNEHRASVLASGELSAQEYPGPAAFLDDADVPDDLPVIQDPAEFEPMMPPNQPDGCYADFPGTELVLTKDFNESDEPCVYGDVDSGRVMYLAGGSHSEHFLPALDIIGREQGFQVVPILKMGCVIGMALPRVNGDPYPECAEWEAKARDHILDNPPSDGVFTTVTRPTTIRGDGPDQIPAEYADMVEELSDAGIHTWAVRDTPWMMGGPGEMLNARVCVGEGRDPGEDCGVAQEDALLPVDPALTALDGMDATHIDLTDAVCRDGRCPAVVGNVLVYRDSQHITSRFSEMLAPELTRQMYDPEAQDEMAERAAEARLTADDEVEPSPKDVFRMPKPGEDGYVEPEGEQDVDPVPEQGWVDPGYVDPGWVDPGYVDPGWVDPGYVDPGWVDPGYVDPGYVDPGYAPLY